jgi:ribosomal protein S18 acetylase RimI-like enzyme
VAITIRPALAADLAGIGDVHFRSRDAAYSGLVPAEALAAVPGPAMAQWWEQRWTYERDTHRLTVAIDGGEVVGFTYVGPAAPNGTGTGELYAIHVHPDRHGTGIGRALMAQALRTLADLDAARAVLWVLTGNARARRFYELGGWTSDDVERDSPIGAALTRQVRYSRAVGDFRLGGST